jgi:hypothetical protein
VATVFEGVRRIPTRWLALWALLAAGIFWFLADALPYAFKREPQPGATFLNRELWYFGHVATAVPILLIAPLQFLASVRQAQPIVHRWLGRTFLAFSIIAGAFAVWLGATIQYEGSRIPLVLFGLIWIGFAAAAWICAVKRDFANHRKFVIRSFAIGLAFVWVRALGELDDNLMAFMSQEQVRDTSQEYLSFILPLLATEIWLSWAPALRSALRRR